MATGRTASSGESMISSRRGETGETGVSTTEMAVIMPVLIILVLLPVHVALWWHAKQVADLAAEEAVEAAQVEGASEADGTAAARSLLAQAGHVKNAKISVTISGDTVQAEVRGESGFQVVPGTWSVAGTAEGRVERFVGEQER